MVPFWSSFYQPSIGQPANSSLVLLGLGLRLERMLVASFVLIFSFGMSASLFFVSSIVFLFLYFYIFSSFFDNVMYHGIISWYNLETK